MYRICLVLLLISGAFGAVGQDYIELAGKCIQLWHEGKYAEAVSLGLKAKDAARKEFGDTSVAYASSVSTLASFYQKAGDYAAAEPLYKEASVVYKNILGQSNSAIATKIATNNYSANINSLAYLYVSMGNYAVAEPLYNQALTIIKKVLGEEHTNYASSLNGFAILHKNTGNYVVAESQFKQALAITKKQLGEEQPLYAERLNNLASLYESMGNYAAAEPLYNQALGILKKFRGTEHPDYAQNLNNLAGLYKTLGNYAKAESLFKQVLAINKKMLGEEHPLYAQSLNNLGDLYATMGTYSAAEPFYKLAISIYKKALGEEHPDYASSLSNLGDLYLWMENYPAAGLLDKQALAIRKKVLGQEHPDYAISLNNLASLYQRMGNFAAAEQLYKEASAIYKKVLGEQDPAYGVSLNNLATIYENMGDYGKAARYLVAGTKLAFDHIEKNFNDLSEVEKLKWWESKRGNFQTAPSLLFTDPKSSVNFLHQACTQQLQLKGFVLNDGAKVLEQVRKDSNPQLQQLLNQWQSNKAILARQYSLPIVNRIPGLDNLEKQANDQEKQINLQSAGFRTSRENQQIGFAQVRQQLKQDEAAVEFIRFEFYHKRWTDSILYAAFIILPNDIIPHFVTFCEEKALTRLLENESNSSEQFVKQLYRGSAVSNDNRADGKKGDSLYTLVWKPLLPWLKGIKKISIAPAGLLNRVAFNALPVDSNSYLIDKYELRQYSSIRQIAEKKIPFSKPGATTDAILYGGIDFTEAAAASVPANEIVSNTLPDNVRRSIRGGIWNQLPGTLQEVNSISKLFNANKKNSRIITGTAATEESFKQLSGHSPTILHLATHGFSLPDAEQKRKDNVTKNDNQFTLADNPLLRSGIIMAGANRVWGGGAPLEGKEDGIVTAYEISNLDLSNTELVVLSACETALGDIKGTEGVFGLQRAFKLAGVKNMILSLWQVPDQETAELMNLLYTNKLKGLTNYEAFYKAQDTMRKKYPPYYWAAFVLIE